MMKNKLFCFISGALLPLGFYWIINYFHLKGIGALVIVIFTVIAFVNRRKNSSFALGIMFGLWLPFLMIIFGDYQR